MGQLVWGVLLILMGVAVFFRVPSLMEEISRMDHLKGMSGVIRFCFYIMGGMLIGGGVKKIKDNKGKK